MLSEIPENVNVTPTSVDFHAVQAQFSFLQGKVLTIIEASLPEGKQLEAVKGLIKGAFRDQTDYVARICFPELPMFSQSELESQGIDLEKVVVEQGLVD
jgi:hypothetical protein